MSRVLDYCSPRVPAHFEKLIARGWEELGSGASSTVVARPNSKWAIKLGPMDDTWLDFYSYTTEHPSPYFPKIKKAPYFIDDFYVAVIERLNKTVSEAELSNWWYDMKFGTIDDPNFPGLREVIADLRNSRDCLDMHDENVMFRFDGSLVITDPF